MRGAFAINLNEAEAQLINCDGSQAGHLGNGSSVAQLRLWQNPSPLPEKLRYPGFLRGVGVGVGVEKQNQLQPSWNGPLQASH